VALSGTLETFSLPDVLRLLSSTKKTGLLALDGDRGTGRVWVDGGEIAAAEADRAVVDDVDAVLFELLRFADAAFEFDAGAEAPDTDVRRDVDEALEVAGARLEEWREIEAVVPSLDVAVRMVSEVDAEVTLGPDVWRVLACVGTGARGHDVARHLEQGEFEVCRSLRDLVEGGLVEVTEVPAEEPAPVEAEPEPAVVDAFAAMVHAPAEPAPVHEVVEVQGIDDADEVDEVDEVVEPVWDEAPDAAPAPSPWEVAEAELRADAPTDAPADAGDDLASDLALLSPKAAAAVQATWSQDAEAPAEAPEPADEAPAAGGDDLDQNLLLRFLSSAKH